MNDGPLKDLLKESVKKQLLLYAAGKQIFCPMCNVVLDWKTVAIFTASHEVHGKNTQICCNKCADNPGVKERMKKFIDLGFTFEIETYKSPTDGN